MALSKERRQITPGEIRMTHFREELREKFGMRTVKSRMDEKIKPVTDSITNAEEKTPVLSVETTSTESASTPTSAEPKKRKSRSATLRTDTGEEAAPVAASEPKPMAQPEPILTSEPQPVEQPGVISEPTAQPAAIAEPTVDAQPATSRRSSAGEAGIAARLAQENSDLRRDRDRATRIGIVGGIGMLATGVLVGAVAFGKHESNPANAQGANTKETPGATQKLDGGMPSQAPSFSPDGSGVIVSFPPASQAPVASATAEANSETQVSATPSEEVTLFITPASKDANGNWVINTPDAEASTIKGIEGFTPDSNLVLAPEWGQVLKLDSAKFADFQKSLNNPKHPLVGYTYGENDQSDNLNYRRTLQAPLNSWTVLTGEEVEVPGIGHLKANPGGAVEVMIMNITDSVIDFGPKNPVMIKHGFTGTGRIWDGKNVVEDERGIASHYVSRLENGVTLPGESGFIGQCDKPENCEDIKVVSAIYTQWGNNQDGTPRYQFQLLRQEQVNN